jgi:hypothetical protein
MPSFVLLMPGFSTRANRDSIAQTTTSTWNSSRATLREENVEKDLGPEEWQPTNGASRFGADERHFGKKILLVFHFSPDLAFALSDLVDSARLVPSSTLASPATCKSFELWNRRKTARDEVRGEAINITVLRLVQSSCKRVLPRPIETSSPPDSQRTYHSPASQSGRCQYFTHISTT